MIFISISIPVKIAAVHNRTANLHCMSVHVFAGGMCHNVSAPLKRAAVDWCRKRIIHNQRHFMIVRQFCKFFNIKHYQSRVGNCLRKHNLGVRTKCLRNLFRRIIRIYECAVNAELLHGNSEEVEGSSVDGRRCYDMITGLADIKHSIEVCSLAGRSQHTCHTTLQSGDSGSHRIIGRVLKTGVEISLLLQCK